MGTLITFPQFPLKSGENIH